ncbi:MAG: hypothetical protein JNK42_01410 [Caedimonas sp.]|nr:hypothetical protein [Caedimonas sp.]
MTSLKNIAFAGIVTFLIGCGSYDYDKSSCCNGLEEKYDSFTQRKQYLDKDSVGYYMERGDYKLDNMLRNKNFRQELSRCKRIRKEIW